MLGLSADVHAQRKALSTSLDAKEGPCTAPATSVASRVVVHASLDRAARTVGRVKLIKLGIAKVSSSAGDSTCLRKCNVILDIIVMVNL